MSAQPVDREPAPAPARAVAAVVRAPRQADVETLAVGPPGEGEVLVRVSGCGVCGSDLAGWEGRPWFEYPFPPGAPGHEAWGLVEETGPEVTGLEAGDAVALLGNRGFASHVVVPALDAVVLPDELRGQPFPGEAIGCAMNAFGRSDIRSGQTVGVVGVGFLGALLVRLASEAGGRVVALARRPYALEVARRMGAAATVPLADGAVEHVRDLLDGQLCDRVIEAAGAQRTLDVATELTRERGRLAIVGYHQDGRRQVDMQLWNWRGLDVVNAHERDPDRYRRGIRDAVEAVTSGLLDPRPLYTHTFPLNRLGDALETAAERPEGFMKALVLA